MIQLVQKGVERVNNKEFLNEESYQQTKKKITKISLIILIVGVVLGVTLIAIGIIKGNLSKTEAEKINEERYNAAYQESQAKVDAANKRLDEIAKEKQELNNQISTKEYECDSMSMGMDNWFADIGKCQSEVSSLESRLSELEMEEFGLENADYTVYYTQVFAKKYIFLYFIGGSIIGLSCLASGVFYLIAKRREIKAFTIQQTMPVTQEVIGKMAPTVGNAAGTIAQGITSGIKEGLKDNNKQE